MRSKLWLSARTRTARIRMSAAILLFLCCVCHPFCASAAQRTAAKADTRPQKDAFFYGSGRNVERAGFTFWVPSYWDQEGPDFFYAETGLKSAFLMMTESDFPLEYLQFLHKPARILDDINEGMNPLSHTVLDISTIRGIPVVCESVEGRIQALGETYPYQGYILIAFNIEKMQTAVTGLMVSDNTRYRYDNEFWRIVLSLSREEDSARSAPGFPGFLEDGRTALREFRHLAGTFRTADTPVRSCLWPVLQAYIRKNA